MSRSISTIGLLAVVSMMLGSLPAEAATRITATQRLQMRLNRKTGTHSSSSSLVVTHSSSSVSSAAARLMTTKEYTDYIKQRDAADKARFSSSSSSLPVINGNAFSDRIKTNMATWTEARKELTTKEDNMSHQPAGKGCMPTLAAIDQDWVMNYNNYVDLLNSSGDVSYAMQTPERQMLDVIKRIHAAPTFCY